MRASGQYPFQNGAAKKPPSRQSIEMSDSMRMSKSSTSANVRSSHATLSAPELAPT